VFAKEFDQRSTFQQRVMAARYIAQERGLAVGMVPRTPVAEKADDLS